MATGGVASIWYAEAWLIRVFIEAYIEGAMVSRKGLYALKKVD